MVTNRVVESEGTISYIPIMKNLIFALLACCLSFSPTGSVFAADSLKALQWKKRPLLLFSKSRSDASLDKQVALLRELRPELRERDMIVLRTSGTEETRSVIGYTSINRGTARSLRRQFKPQERGLTVVLIGKDGEEKQCWNRVVDPQELFDLIDAMPMRKKEIDQQASN